MKKSVCMTEGPIGSTMFWFILPLIGSSVFQQLYNTADFFLVSNFLGTTAAAAVGASGTLVTCTIGLFSGIAVGTSVVAAQAIGAQDAETADRALHTSLLFGAAGGVVLMLLGLCFAPGFLRILDTPASVLPQAVVYIRIYFLSLPASILYNMCAGALRACGDSRTPLGILAVFGVVNVLLDCLLILVIPLGVAGAAIATVLCQWMSLAAVLLCLSRPGRPVRLSHKMLRWDARLLGRVLRVGLPSGIQTIVITFSDVMVQYYINGLGETAVAAFATYYKVENFIYLPIMAFGQASTTFAGQNMGAGQLHRIRRGTAVAAALGVAVTAGISGMIYLFQGTVYGWFIDDAAVIADAMVIGAVVLPSYWVYPIMEACGGALRGMGYSLSSMGIILVNLCVARVGLLALFSRHFHTLGAIASVYPITWATAMVCFVIVYFAVMGKKAPRSADPPPGDDRL